MDVRFCIHPWVLVRETLRGAQQKQLWVTSIYLPTLHLVVPDLVLGPASSQTCSLFSQPQHGPGLGRRQTFQRLLLRMQTTPLPTKSKPPRRSQVAAQTSKEHACEVHAAATTRHTAARDRKRRGPCSQAGPFDWLLQSTGPSDRWMLLGCPARRFPAETAKGGVRDIGPTAEARRRRKGAACRAGR